ncbi:tetratricopeptide repeat protein [uncultured Boseongicola sp.]|jgi:tol-pal system protein YbgF|uniref:tetratricopeptide repeat protein n=1 Tax=uncultured Boseongicola sp. TaxID=1648499 RepID=UPI002631829D|nr:tetratricopeptide repeat protein [uncultured Boseongicola sp.]
MRWILIVAMCILAVPAVAQDREKTLADIRQELSVLFVEIQKMRRELSTTGGVNANLSGTNVLERVDAMEAELQRVIAANEALTNRVDRVVSDGTNRIGDLEFRLCELESGCDIGSLGETPTLGGGALPTAVTPQPVAPVGDVTGGVELAVAERDDFDRAKATFDAGSFEAAAEQLQRFTETYQGGPLTGLAHLMRGEALQSLGLTSSAARAYLESYSGTPNGPTSPTALLKLGLALDGLGQNSEACITLAEVTLRYPDTEASIEAQAARASMGCV